MSKLVKSFAAALVLSMSCSAFAADATMKADATNIDTDCATEAQTAGCGADKVGSGLMKCLHDYKKAHKDFKPSEKCHAAMKQMHMDKEAGK